MEEPSTELYLVTTLFSSVSRNVRLPIAVSSMQISGNNWSYNDLAKWRYADLPRALGCADWVTACVETLGELDAAMKAARETKSGADIEVIGGRLDMPKSLAFAPAHLKELYGDTP